MIVTAPLSSLRRSCPRSKRLAVLALAALTTGGCASLRTQEAPGCTGPRRPANPHGTVLNPGAAPSAAPNAPNAGPCAGAPR